MKFTLLIGMPGSGKTTLGNKILKENSNTLFLDDISLLSSNAEIFVLEQIKNNPTISHIIIADVFFCETPVLKNAIAILKSIAHNCEIEHIYFENNPTKCHSNVDYRKTFGDVRRVTYLINTLTRKYLIPHEVKPVSIMQMS